MKLLEPYLLGKLEMANRIVRSATWDGTADASGAPTDYSVALYRELARGGVGLIITGYAFVSANGQAMHGQYGIHNDDMVPGLRRLVQAVHAEGGKICLQMAHAGVGADYLIKKGLSALAVSHIPKFSRAHRAMTGEEIETIIADFAAAAVRAREAGFDAVQFHGAHGYLLSQFLSPLFNLREDQWGGSLANRRRFHLEAVRRTRRALGDDFPVMVKFGAQDDRKGGLTLEEGMETAREMVAAGIDAVEISTGVGASMLVLKEGEPERAFFRDRAAAARRQLTVPVIAVGGIRSLEMAGSIIDSGDADLVAMCRPFIREPGLVARWQRGDRSPARCISCNKCFQVAQNGAVLECQRLGA